VPEPLRVAAGVVVPARAISVRAVRSSGPGGQNVNKVASKVELRVELAAIEGLDEDARRRLAALARSRLDADGFLLVTSQRTRDQRRNLADARAKAGALIARSLLVPRRRRPTRPSAAGVERRLGRKRRAAERKRARRPRAWDEEG
jgi:ribosome-associated protein